MILMFRIFFFSIVVFQNLTLTQVNYLLQVISYMLITINKINLFLL